MQLNAQQVETFDRDGWRRMGERGAAHVHARFSWATVTDRLVSCLFAGA